MVIWAQANYVACHIRTVVRFAERLQVVAFGVAGSVGQPDRLAADLAKVLVLLFHPSCEYGVPDDPRDRSDDPIC
jgi:hypothetical protein